MYDQTHNWRPYFAWLFQAWKPGMLIEYGLGVGTGFLLDAGIPVVSVEIAVRPDHLVWWKRCLELYGDRGSWTPVLHEASLVFCDADAKASRGGHPLQDVGHGAELAGIVTRALVGRTPELIFVDPGTHIRGALVNLSLPRALVVAAHDTNYDPTVYGWNEVVAVDHVEVSFPLPKPGTTFWVHRSRQDLVEHLRAFPTP